MINLKINKYQCQWFKFCSCFSGPYQFLFLGLDHSLNYHLFIFFRTNTQSIEHKTHRPQNTIHNSHSFIVSSILNFFLKASIVTISQTSNFISCLFYSERAVYSSYFSSEHNTQIIEHNTQLPQFHSFLDLKLFFKSLHCCSLSSFQFYFLRKL